ncbi:hypothetical protein ONZ45_g19480 [Pleurotus djamor]|nr:hypothetical protein ONZ45_g19480 [Pleurotus djamor]
MEVLGALTAPPLLQIAYSYLTIAWQQYGVVQGHKEQCSLILNRCQDLLVEVCRVAQRDDFTPEMQSNIVVLESACQSVKDTICHVAGKGFAWRLLNQDKVVQAIAIAENSISDAFACFNFGAHLSAQRLQIDIEEARQKDHLSLVSQLEGLAENDQKILSALQADQRGRHRLEELVIALTKHVRNLSPTETNSDPTNKFLRTASATLQRLSNNPSPEIPHWSVTSLEVNFDPDEEATCIGRGGFGNIYKGEWNGLVVAVKEMYSEDARMLDRSNMKAILHEIKIWSRLTHPHVLPFYCACLEANKPFMVSRYCPNGNALEFLRKYPEYQRIPMLHEISLGMVYLHSQSVIHSDLKASNILIGDDGKALIADFGLSFLQEQASTGATRTMASSSQRLNGTLRWMAPELIDGEKLDKPADVYSYALLLWELYTGQVPYGDIPDRAFARRVVDKQERPSRPSNFDNDTLWLLTQSCWSPEPSSRPVFPVIQAKLRQLKSAIRGNDGPSLPTSPVSAYSASSSISQMTAVNSPSSLDSTLSPLSGTTVSNTSLEPPKAKSEGTPVVNAFDHPTQTLEAPNSATSILEIPHPPDTPITHSPLPSEISSEPHASQPPTPSPRSPGYRALQADVVTRSGLLRERSPAPSSSLPERPYPSSKVQKKNMSNASDSGTSTPLTSPPEVVEEKADHDGSQPRADILKTLNDIYSTKSRKEAAPLSWDDPSSGSEESKERLTPSLPGEID